MHTQRLISVPCPHTEEAIRKGVDQFGDFEWTPEKKRPLEIRVPPDSVTGPLPALIDGIPVRICHTGWEPSVLLMGMQV